MPAATRPNQQVAVANLIWDCLDAKNEADLEKLDAFFPYYERIVRDQKEKVLFLIDVLKRNPTRTRAEIVKALSNPQPDYPSQLPLSSRVDIPTEVPVFAAGEDVENSLCAAARILLALDIGSNLSGASSQVPVGPAWETSKSLQDFIQSAIPKTGHSISIAPGPLRRNKLRAKYLTAYADFEIEWVEKLSDHLNLIVGDRNKILQIFKIASMLEVSYETLRDEDINMSLSESLNR